MRNKVNWKNWNSKTDNFKKYKNIKSNIIYGNFSEKIPKVSIIIITYKRSEGLKRALESALKQDYKNDYEIIVCDDSEYDEKTDKLMKKYCDKYDNIIYYRNEKNLGQYANWNRACELCRTEWYCLLHDDDMIKSNYLSVLTKIVSGLESVGLVGSYMDTYNFDTGQIKKTIIELFVNIFIKLRLKKPIKITLSDNIKHIYISSCCLFINKNKVKNIGGLNDKYFPSSDFVLSAKMNYYYSTLFLPIKLSLRGVGNNESLKQSVCDDSLRCAYNQTYNMCKTLGYNEKKCIRKASMATVISEIGVRGYNNVNYGKVKTSLGIKKIYNNKFVIFLINLYSKFNWGLLLFRR